MDNNQGGQEARRSKRIENRPGIALANVGVRNDGATRCELQACAFTTDPVKQTRCDFDVVTATAKWDMNGAHGLSIKIVPVVSKF